MYRAFRADPAYLTKTHAKSALVLAVTNAALWWALAPDLKTAALFVPSMLLLSSTNVLWVAAGYGLAVAATILGTGFSATDLWWPVISLPWTFFATAILHNASHDNIKPRWLRRPVGEIFGLAQLVNFADWVVIHVIHHSHPDDPSRDPHPPLNLSYWQFLKSMRASILKVLLREYFTLWGQTPQSITHIKQLSRWSKTNQMMKIVFWWLVLGPRVFTWLFATSIVFKMLHYAWFNWATHKATPEGAFDTVNLDTPLYKAVNALSFGLYYHRNHHLNPKLFDPRKMSERTAAAKTEAA